MHCTHLQYMTKLERSACVKTAERSSPIELDPKITGTVYIFPHGNRTCFIHFLIYSTTYGNSVFHKSGCWPGILRIGVMLRMEKLAL